MTDLLPILASIYVVYVLYEIFKTVSESDRIPTQPIADIPAASQLAPAPQAEPAPTPTPISTTAVTASQPAPAPAEHAKIVNLRNPETGEISPVPGNYRFAKKWIKEAIVTEGLLHKVYKNSELNEAVNPKVKTALEQFKKLEKYHA